MAKGKNKTVKKVTIEDPEVIAEIEKETVTKYYALYQFAGNRNGGDILVGDEVFAKDFGGDEYLAERVKKEHVEERQVEV